MCSGIRFTDTQGNMYFGRNLDWGCGYGQSIFVTQRGFTNPKFMDGKVATKYAMIGTAIVEEECPLYFDIGNEAGLAIAGLNFPGYAQYEKAPIEGKVNIPAYAFPMYIASQFATVNEAEEALENIVITDEPFSPQLPVSLLHWIIGDKDRSIVVEYMEDGMHVYNNDLDVLTNQPTFPYHRENVRSYLNCSSDYHAPVKWSEATLEPYGSGSCMRGIPGDFYSPSRFVRAAYMNAMYPKMESETDNIARLFHTLLSVSMTKGGAKMEDGTYEYTVYTGGYSSATKKYYCNTYDDLAIKAYSLEKEGLDGGKCFEAPLA